MGLEAALARETCTFGLTKKLPCLDSSFTKITIELYTATLEAFLFQMNRDNGGNSIDLILVANVLCLLSDYRKEEIIRSMNLISGFRARSYSIRCIHLPVVLLA